jgi:hypothetical protein
MLTDGRPPDTPEMARQMVAAFVPRTVPILSRHRGAHIGYVDGLSANRSDLRLTGEVVDYPDILDALRAGVPISIEVVEAIPAVPAAFALSTDRAAPTLAAHPHYSGQLCEGWNLIGVALSNRPAARDSVLWLAS